ncbi:MAG: class I SAM-dependent methyltransferase [Acidimicrobiia bacterium]|nr:class I SAM-dependent methyltransferase [Acidimicrobiia bacterium]
MTSEQWDERYALRELVWTARPNQFLVSETASLVPGRALDIACGEGRNAVWLAEEGWEVTGVDFSPVGIEKANRLGADRGVEVAWAVVDIVEWKAPSGSYDLVIVFYLHVLPADRRAVLGHAASALAPGGTLLVVGHALRNLTEGYGGPPTADGLYTPEEVAGELPGLIIERADEVIRPVEVDGETHNAIDALVRARRA